MAVDWTPEVEARVRARMGAIHNALAGERSRADAWAGMLGVQPGEGFTRFMTGVLSAACAEAPVVPAGDQHMAGAAAGVSYGVGVAVALAYALAEDDLT